MGTLLLLYIKEHNSMFYKQHVLYLIDCTLIRNDLRLSHLHTNIEYPLSVTTTINKTTTSQPIVSDITNIF